MKKWAKRVLLLLMLGLLILSFTNASWLASPPGGTLKLIAHRGVYHLYDKRAAVGKDTCTAQHILPPRHEIFENTIRSMQEAVKASANLVEVDVAPTKDGKMVLFHDWGVDCRTNGKGETREQTLAQLKALDIGYGYTADGGKTYPLRGKGVGQIPTVAEALAYHARHPILFHFKSKNPAEADLLYAIIKASGRRSEELGDAFYGHEAPVGRMRQLLPKNWAYANSEVKACTKDYVIWGWFGIVPESCKGKTIAVALNYQWVMPGWPNRMAARMKEANTRIILYGPFESGKSNEGLSKLDQLGKVPRDFTGYLWVEDIRTLGPAIRR